jgi:N4-gp56 family major capsid protein
MNRFMSKGTNSIIQRITELKKSEKGARAVITLVPDLEGDGVVGDSTLEGNEEEIKAFDQVIRIDQLRNANRLQGRLADQKSVVTFREQSRDVLAYWLADRLDQLAILSMSGVAYTQKMSGEARPVLAVGRNLSDLEYAADVTAPSTNRHFRWDATSGWEAGNTAAVETPDIITYESLVRAKTIAKNKYIRGIRAPGGEEVFHVFLTPDAMATLKLDADYQGNVRNAAPRSKQNEVFAGTSSVMVDGLVIHEHRHIFNTNGLTTAVDKWGAGADVDGFRALLCGAQAIGFADIGNPFWEEDDFDYKNQPAISVGKMCGFLKPVFRSIYDGTDEDFGILALDYAQTLTF